MNKYTKKTWVDAVVDEHGSVINSGTLITSAELGRMEDGIEAAVLNAIPTIKTSGTATALTAADGRLVNQFWEGYSVKVILHIAPALNATIKLGSLTAFGLGGITAKVGDILLLLYDSTTASFKVSQFGAGMASGIGVSDALATKLGITDSAKKNVEEALSKTAEQISNCLPKITGSFSGTKTALTFTDNNYTLTDFLTVKLKLHIDIGESDSPTFNFNNTGAKQIVYPNKSVIKSALPTGSVLELMYNSDISKWYILNELGGLDTSIVDVWQTWVQLAGLSPSTYGSLSAVVSSSSAMTVLCASSKASSYMSKSLSVILPAVAGNATSSTALGQSSTALNALYSEAVANSATALTIETILSASICINALIAIATTSSNINTITFQSIVSKPTLLLQWRGYSGTSTPEPGYAKTFITGDNKTNRTMTANATFYNCLGFMSELSMMASGAGSSRFMVAKYITW